MGSSGGWREGVLGPMAMGQDAGKESPLIKNCQIKAKVRLWHEFLYLEIMESLEGAHFLPERTSQIMSPQPHSQGVAL